MDEDKKMYKGEGRKGKRVGKKKEEAERGKEKRDIRKE